MWYSGMIKVIMLDNKFNWFDKKITLYIFDFFRLKTEDNFF